MIVLLADFRKPLRMLTALAPLVMGVVLTLGIMGLCGLPLNPANMIAFPLILGVGVDNGVHVLHDYLSHRREGDLQLSYTTGRGILVAALTTILGFGTLMISHHRGLFSLGFILTLGVDVLHVIGARLPARHPAGDEPAPQRGRGRAGQSRGEPPRRRVTGLSWAGFSNRPDRLRRSRSSDSHPGAGSWKKTHFDRPSPWPVWKTGPQVDPRRGISPSRSLSFKEGRPMHGTATRGALILSLFLMAAEVSRGDPLATKSPEQERPEPAKLAALIHQLGEDDFYERESASEALEEIGEVVMEDLRKVADSDADLEIRHRAAVIVDKIEVRIGLVKGPASSEELIGHLKESKYPSYREWAAEQLAFVSDTSRGAAVEALLAACNADAASNVRLACIRSLGVMKMATPTVLNTLRKLRKDADPRVAAEADKAYVALPRQLPPPPPMK